MRAVVQRVGEAQVRVDGRVCGAIDRGLLVYLGVDRDDADSDASYLADKVRFLRLFGDETSRINLDVAQAGGAVLVVSAFTVSADARRGRRPSLETAASPDRAAILYEMFCAALGQSGVSVQRGAFGEHMIVHAVNDGPVCILLESRRLF